MGHTVCKLPAQRSIKARSSIENEKLSPGPWVCAWKPHANEEPAEKRRKEEERNPKKNEKTLGTAKQAELGVAAGDAVLSQYGSVLMLSTMFA